MAYICKMNGIKKKVFILVLWIGIGLPIFVNAQEALIFESLPIRMESGGGWVALERNFFGNVNMNVVQAEPRTSPIQRVLEAIKVGKIAFGVDGPENIIQAREKEGIDLVAVSVDFQTSGMRIVSWVPIKSAKEIKGNFSIWMGYEARVKCAVGKGWEKQLTFQNQRDDLQSWFNGSLPFASAMTYRELIWIQRELKKMGKRFYTIDYQDLGIDWMDNALFTTEEIIRKYPEIVQAVVTGRYKGFQWSLENPREAFEILKKIDNHLEWTQEMDAVSPMRALMVTPETRKHGLGYPLPKKWEKIVRDMFRAELIKKMPEAKKFYTEKFPSGVIAR